MAHEPLCWDKIIREATAACLLELAEDEKVLLECHRTHFKVEESELEELLDIIEERSRRHLQDAETTPSEEE